MLKGSAKFQGLNAELFVSVEGTTDVYVCISPLLCIYIFPILIYCVAVAINDNVDKLFLAVSLSFYYSSVSIKATGTGSLLLKDFADTNDDLKIQVYLVLNLFTPTSAILLMTSK